MREQRVTPLTMSAAREEWIRGQADRLGLRLYVPDVLRELDAARARLAALEPVARAAVAWHVFPGCCEGMSVEADLADAVDALPEEMKRAYASDTPQASRKELGG